MIVKLLKPLAVTGGAFAATVLLAGCGGGGSTDNPATTAENFLHLLAKGDTEGMCLMMADDEDGPMEKDTPVWHECLAATNSMLSEAAGDDLGEYSEAGVEVATVDGNTAEVSTDQIRGVAEPEFGLELALFDGKWYVTDLD